MCIRDSEYSVRDHPALANDAPEHFLCLAEELARGLPYDRILQDFRVWSGELPGLEERRPVDVVDELGERIVAHCRYAQLARRGRDVALPVDGVAETCLLYTSPSPRDS